MVDPSGTWHPTELFIERATVIILPEATTRWPEHCVPHKQQA